MNIRITEYTREDGLQAITFMGQWVLRRKDGVCQFYQKAFETWVVTHALCATHVDPDKDMRTCFLSLEEALNLLGTLPPIK